MFWRKKERRTTLCKSFEAASSHPGLSSGFNLRSANRIIPDVLAPVRVSGRPVDTAHHSSSLTEFSGMSREASAALRKLCVNHQIKSVGVDSWDLRRSELKMLQLETGGSGRPVSEAATPCVFISRGGISRAVLSPPPPPPISMRSITPLLIRPF